MQGPLTLYTTSYEPHITRDTVSFTVADTSKVFEIKTRATTAGGSVTSGTAMFVLASVPQKPAPPTNDPLVTNDTQIRVLYGTVLPNDGGSPILDI